MADPVDDLETLIRTRHAMVTIRTAEEGFADRCIRQAARELDMAVLEWTVSDGLRRVFPDEHGMILNTDSLAGALAYMVRNPKPLVYVLKDALGQLGGAKAQRLLREVGRAYSADRRTVFLIDAEGELPGPLRPFAVPYDLPLPDADEIYQIVKRTVRQLRTSEEVAVKMSQEEFHDFLANLRGLTRMEISRVVAEAVLGDGRLEASDVDRVAELKRRRLRATGVLDYVPAPEDPPKVGGMDALRRWLSLREKALTPQARQYGLDLPRGILLLGVQGCGKSLMARHVAASWRLPLLRMDVGALYDKYVGETEKHLRTAFDVADAMAPCVLWIDEIEKAFASAGAGSAGAASDGGLSHRVFGQLLTWMQDHAEPVFLVATANDVSALPPELMRKGRFDEVFFVDLPDAEARREIFRIHLARRKRKPGDFDLEALAAASEGFSGSEIEQAVVAAMYAAFAAGREVSTEDLRAELSQTQPLSVLMAEKVAALRAWAQGRCVRAD